MKFYFTVVGAVFGGVAAGWDGIWIGAIIGIFADLRQQRVEGRIQELQTRLDDIEVRPLAATAAEDAARESAREVDAVLERKVQTPPSQASPAVESETPKREPVLETPQAQTKGPSIYGPKLPDDVPARPVSATEGPADNGVPPWRDIVDRLKSFAGGGNTIVRVGMLVLFIGLSLLVKYAADNALFPVELRLASTAIAGIALLVAGWRLRERRRGYAMVLQGGAVAVLYLTVFAAYRLFDLIPAGAAFGLLVAIAALGAVLAVQQDTQTLAIIAALGGFFAPVIASTGEGSHVVLFSYYIVLNLAILGSAWYKSWRPLHVVGFFCTFGIGTMWGGLRYQSDFFSTTEPFLIAFFLIYFAVSLFHARRQAPRLSNVVDGTLVFGLPVVVFSLQSVLVEPFPFGLAWSAFVLGCFYATAASLLFKRAPDTVRLLVQSFAGLSLALGTMTLPFALNATWTGAGWALEGAALVWLGFRQKSWLVRASGYLLQAGASVALWPGLAGTISATPILNALFVACLSITISMLFSAYQVHKNRHERLAWERFVEPFLVVVGLFWWFRAGIWEIMRGTSADEEVILSVVFAIITLGATTFAGVRDQWPWLRRPGILLLPIVFVFFVAGLFTLDSFFEDGGFAVWPLSVASILFVLAQLESDFGKRSLGAAHAGTIWYVALLGVWMLYWFVEKISGAGQGWEMSALVAPPIAVVAVVTYVANRRRWPFPQHAWAYLLGGIVPILAGLSVVALNAVTGAEGGADPLPFVPLLNPLDLVFSLGAVAAFFWYRTSREYFEYFQTDTAKAAFTWFMAAAGFIWLNGTLARTVHHWADVPYVESAMFSSALFQTAVTIFWTILGVSIMVFGARRRRRATWFVGAALLGVVVVKLFLIDLSSISVVARIVSFIVVGLLLLLVGYVAPVPPRALPSESRDDVDETISPNPIQE